MKSLIGTKEHMTQIFLEDGVVRAGTVLSLQPMKVTHVKDIEKDGYGAVQIGWGEQKEKRLSKAVLGHMKKAGGAFRGLREFRAYTITGQPAVGEAVVPSELFAVGDKVSVAAISKGKGFQGVVKRHGFAGGQRTHGQKHSEREPGSIGSTGPQRVFKGTRMAGRMGGNRVTVRNLKVLAVDPNNTYIVVSGAVPGRRGTIVEVHGA